MSSQDQLVGVNTLKTQSAIYSTDGLWLAQGGIGMNLTIWQNAAGFASLKVLESTEGVTEVLIASKNKQLSA